DDEHARVAEADDERRAPRGGAERDPEHHADDDASSERDLRHGSGPGSTSTGRAPLKWSTAAPMPSNVSSNMGNTRRMSCTVGAFQMRLGSGFSHADALGFCAMRLSQSRPDVRYCGWAQ